MIVQSLVPLLWPPYRTVSAYTLATRFKLAVGASLGQRVLPIEHQVKRVKQRVKGVPRLPDAATCTVSPSTRATKTGQTSSQTNHEGRYTARPVPERVIRARGMGAALTRFRRRVSRRRRYIIYDEYSLPGPTSSEDGVAPPCGRQKRDRSYRVSPAIYLVSPRNLILSLYISRRASDREKFEGASEESRGKEGDMRDGAIRKKKKNGL